MCGPVGDSASPGRTGIGRLEYDRPVRIAAAVLIALLGSVTLAFAADPPLLARARAFYNAGNYDAAIEAATLARNQPATADSAALVLARAHVERYRAARTPTDLTAAREALHGLTRAKLAPREQVDLFVALGQVLFFDGDFGAAAEVFESALARASFLPPQGRGQLLDWWANALDREAQSRAPDRRAPVFARVVTRMEQEIGGDPVSVTANYWLPAGIRGTGDLERAWDAVIAAWVRTSLDPQTAPAVRADLDRLAQTLAVERSRQRPPREQAEAANALRAEWDNIKSKW
jgi:hypothetical protein